MGALFWYHGSSFMIASGIVMVLMPLVVFLWGQNATFWKELCGYVMVLDVKLILEGVSASNSPNYIPE